MKSLFAVVLGVVLVAAYHASTEAAPADDDKLRSVVDPPETDKGETTTVTELSASIGDLPDDVLRRVFSLVSAAGGPEALLDPLSQVCRQWRSVTQDPAFWDRVDLVVKLAPTAQANEDDLRKAQSGARILLGAPALRSLWLEGRHGYAVAEDARFLGPALAWTKAFVRDKLCVDSKAWAALGKEERSTFLSLLRRSAPHLRELKLSGLDNPDGSVAIAADEQGGSASNVLADLQSLKKLDLLRLNPSQAYAGELANVVLPNLQHLRISESHSVADSPKDFHTALVQAAAPALTSLQLDFEPSTSEALQEAVQNCQRLQRVKLIYPGPLTALGECSEIKELKVEFLDLKAEQVEKILHECEKLDKLEELVLVVPEEQGPGSEEWNQVGALVGDFQQRRPQVRVEIDF